MTFRRVAMALVLGAVAAACGRGVLKPEALEVGKEACTYCRMTVSDSHFASQLLVPGELPKFFDDLGCLNHYLTGTAEVPADAVIYVTDHRTNEWVPAASAVFARVPMLATPMSSHFVAHASVESRQADPAAAAGSPVTPDEVIPAAWRAQRGSR